MANVICKICGAQAISKCPYCRTVFPKNEMEGMLSWILKKRMKTDKNGVTWLEISYVPGKNVDLKEAMKRLLNLLNVMEDKTSPYPTIKEYACDHEWVFKEGEKSTIGCGH